MPPSLMIVEATNPQENPQISPSDEGKTHL
jgi:hypothetical protein